MSSTEPTPLAPQIPTIPAPPPAAPLLPGEQWSVLIHGGPGSAGIRAFADALRGHAAGIDEHWIDGVQQAGANTDRHGRWLNSAAGQANTIATAADRIADSFDTTRNAVPTPAEFTAARQDVLTARAAANPVAMSQAVERYSGLNTQTLDAVVAGYHPTTTSVLTGLPGPLPAAPPITRDQTRFLGFGPGGVPEAPPPPLTPAPPGNAARERDERIVNDPSADPEARRLAGERLADLDNAHIRGPFQPNPVMGGDVRTRAQARVQFQELLESGAA